MKNSTTLRTVVAALITVVMARPALQAQTAKDLVHGNLIQFNDNGAWCWYQDERGVVDTTRGILLVGSVADEAGAGGSPRGGDIEAVHFDLKTRLSSRFTLKQGGGSAFYADDHNAPAFLVRDDGKYLAMYAAHFNDTSSYFRACDAVWGPEKKFNWKLERPGGSNFQTTYSNLLYLSDEGRLYNFVRGNNKSPNFMVSTDLGDTWSYGGQLTANAGVGYNNGYYRYWGNGVDRIDILFTEYHPRDYNTSIYHGYVRGGKSYATDGTLADEDIHSDAFIPTPSNFTRAFAAGSVVNGVTMTRCWNIDVHRYGDGTIAGIIKARANDNPDNPSNNPDNRLLYCRYDGSVWSTSYLCKAGPKLFASEQDYTGLGALDPRDPNTIYVSTTFDPRDDATDLTVHEIFKGVTGDGGQTWTWTPVTERSTRDNLRPIIPAWDDRHTALLWWRGTYTNAQTYDASVVGIVETDSEAVGPMTYVDATPANTTLETGSALVATGPGPGQGADDNQWHERTGFGNGSSILASSESGDGEDAPGLRTRISLPGAGTYDLWVNFWAEPTADWRIMAGFSRAGRRLFRHMACKSVEPGGHGDSILVMAGSNLFLYQAYAGRVEVPGVQNVDVYVDDNAVRTGTSGTTVGNTARTWYDGVSYARVGGDPTTSVAGLSDGVPAFALEQNYPNPFNPTTEIRYWLAAAGDVKLAIHDLLGREVAVLVDGRRGAGAHSVTFDSRGLASGVYVYSLNAGGFFRARRLIVLR